MRDPMPENISGEKRHSFSWSIDVDAGRLALAVAVIYVAWKGARLFAGSSPGSVEVGEPGSPEPVVVSEENDKEGDGHTWR